MCNLQGGASTAIVRTSTGVLYSKRWQRCVAAVRSGVILNTVAVASVCLLICRRVPSSNWGPEYS
jgi:hypothetical protein